MTRVWIERRRIERNRAALAAAPDTRRLLPVFRVMWGDGSETIAAWVTLYGTVTLKYDPHEPSMQGKAVAWVETDGDVLVDRFAEREPSVLRCDTPPYASVDAPDVDHTALVIDEISDAPLSAAETLEVAHAINERLGELLAPGPSSVTT